LNVTSLLALPGFLGIDSTKIIEQSDKLTVIMRRAVEGSPASAESICPSINIDVEYANFSEGSDVTEMTGYPRPSLEE
jgi:hypothetical protein